MTKREAVLNEIADMPEPLVDELLELIKSLKRTALDEPEPPTRYSAIGMMRLAVAEALLKKLDRYETAIASESSLKRDWLTPEEDEAWQDL